MKQYLKAVTAGIGSLLAQLGVAAESNGISLSEALTATSAALAIGAGVAWVTNAPAE